MGATASTVRIANEVQSSRRRDATLIPFDGIYDHIRMFQHQKDGDILILANEDGAEFLKDPASSQYFEIYVSKRGKTYLDNLTGAMTFQATKAMMEKAIDDLRGRTSPSQTDPPSGEGDGALTLYQRHLLDHPNALSLKPPSAVGADEPTLSARSKDSRATSEKLRSPGARTDDPFKDRDGAKEGPSEYPAAAGKSTPQATGSPGRHTESKGFGSSPAAMLSGSVSLDYESTDVFGKSGSSSLSHSADGGVLTTTTAAAVNGRADASADAKSDTFPRKSPRLGSAGSKAFDETPVRMPSPRLSEVASPKQMSSEDHHAESKDTRTEGQESKGIALDTSAVTRKPMRQYTPVPYLPHSEHHRKRILELDNAHAQQGSPAPRRNEMSPKDKQTPPRNDGPRSPRSPALDAKGESDHITPKLSPRGLALQLPADGKPPSLRTVYHGAHAPSDMTNASVSTFAVAGIADVASTNVSFSPTVDCCPVCQLELRETSRLDPARYESHLESCRMRQEMKNALQNIDQNLVPKLDELTEFNQAQLQLVYSDAIGRATDELDKCASAHAVVKKMVKSVLRVTYDTSTAKMDRVQASLTAAQADIAACLADAESDHRKGLPDALRKCNACAYLTRVLQHTADKLALKRHNIVRYRKYLVGIQDFRILCKLGQGSFASVYLARVCDTKRLCAIKALSKAEVKERGVLDQVMKERTALAMASRYPDYFVKLLYCCQNEDHLFFVMEYMEGGDCLSLIGTMKRLPEHVAQHFIAQVSMAVRHLHLHGVIHRDIKPDNVMITSRGHAKLGDFGSVHPIHADHLYKRSPQGTAAAPIGPTTPGGDSMAMQSIHSRSESNSHQFSPAKGSMPLIGANNQFLDISTVYKNLVNNAKNVDKSGSNSFSLWLEEELQVIRALSQSESSTSSRHSHWSSSSTSSLCFKRNTTGPVMQNTFDIVGNYFYASPEMAAGVCVFNQSVDWWAVGVLLYHMLSGTTPFEGMTKAATLDNIEHKLVDWDPLPAVSAECRDFLERILTHSYGSRLGSANGDEVIQHPFFATIDLATLYDGYGPIYPRALPTDDSSAELFCFSVLTEEESRDVPNFAPSVKIGSRSRSESDSGTEGRMDGVANTLVPDDPFQEFDYHPF